MVRDISDYPNRTLLGLGKEAILMGVACNYLYKRFLQSGGGKYFGLLDHDIFPIESFDVSIFLEKQFFYGLRHRFYIWPGFFFVRMKEAAQKNLDFRPSLWLRGDTGACNAYSLFKGIDFVRYELVSEEKRNFTQEGDIFDNGYSYFSCGWVHCWNASNYMGKNIDKKWRECSAFLKKSYFRIRIRHLIITKLKGKADILSLAFGNGSNACLVANLL